MSKLLIQRQQVIDCGAETCGKCKQLQYGVCAIWREPIRQELRAGKEINLRCYKCKNAEVRKP
jgi:hypothetical protein